MNYPNLRVLGLGPVWGSNCPGYQSLQMFDVGTQMLCPLAVTQASFLEIKPSNLFLPVPLRTQKRSFWGLHMPGWRRVTLSLALGRIPAQAARVSSRRPGGYRAWICPA